MGRKCFLPLQPSSVAVPGGHNGAFERGSWKGVLAGRLEVEHCSWGGVQIHFQEQACTECQFPKQNCCFSELMVVGCLRVGEKAKPFPIHCSTLPKFKKTQPKHKTGVLRYSSSGSPHFCCLSGSLRPVWRG